MIEMRKPPKRVPWVNASASVASFSLAVWFHRISDYAAEDAVSRYGHNVDSGVLEDAVARFYFLPAGVLFAIAAASMLTRWRWRRAPGYVAWVFLVVPVLLSLFGPML